MRIRMLPFAALVLASVGIGCGSDSETTPVTTPDAGSADHTASDSPAADTSPDTAQADSGPDANEPDTTADAVTQDASDDAGTVACNVAGQDCSGGEKCTVKSGTEGYYNACVPPQDGGTKTAGEECKRLAMGTDDCAPGFFCTFLPGKADPMHCRELCLAHSDCTGEERCVALGRGPASLAGLCLVGCTLFGTDCGDGNTCRLETDPLGVSTVTICYQTSTQGSALGADCGAQAQCKDADAYCDGLPIPSQQTTGAGTGGTCRMLCDDTHPCADTSTTCKPFDGAALDTPHAGLGICR
jgi:hypothetical protein